MISVAITHVSTPERELMLSNLLRSLDMANPIFDEVVDSLLVVTDEQHDGVWPTTSRALWWGLSQPSDHLLLLPDDSVVCRDFISAAARAIAAVPSSPIVFYTGFHYTKEAEHQGIVWTRLERVQIGCLALVMPKELLWNFRDWNDKHFLSSYKHSDVRIETWAYLTGNYIWATDPSLAQHTGEGRSLLGHNGHESHHARRFIGTDVSANGIDFLLGASDPAVSRAKMPAMYRKVIRDLE